MAVPNYTPVQSFKDLVSDKINLKTCKIVINSHCFYLTCGGQSMETMTASLKEYTDGDSRDLEVVVLRLKEGAPKVRKHYLKMLNFSTPPEGDMFFFQKAHGICEMIIKVKTINFDEALMSMNTSIAELKAQEGNVWEHNLCHPRTYDMSQPQLLVVHEKFRDMVKADLETRFDGDIDAIKEKVSNVRAAKLDREQSAQTSRMSH